MSNYDLKNDENYFDFLQSTDPQQYTELYAGIVCEYLKYFFDNSHIQDKKYLLYVMLKGIELIEHIFIMMLVYTRNINCASHYAQKGYFYFIEFIDQVGEKSNSFLKLTCKDAILFTYRKTLFDIPQSKTETSKISSDDNEVLAQSQDYIHSINVILRKYFTVCTNQFNTSEQEIVIKNIIILLTSIANNIEDLGDKLDEIISHISHTKDQTYLSINKDIQNIMKQ